MKRKAAWCGLSFLAGTLLYCTAGDSFLPLAAAAAALTLLALLTAVEYRVYAAAVGISVLCGLCCGRAYALFHISPALELEGRSITAEGAVTDCRVQEDGRFILTVDGRAEGRSVTMLFTSEEACEPYEIIRVTGKAEALADSDDFPAKSYYLPKGIYLRAEAEGLVHTGRYGSALMRGITRLRDYTAKCIAGAMGPETGAFAQALICGDKSDMSLLDRTKVYRAGIGHIFAMSGTHIAVIAMLFDLLIGSLVFSRRIRFFLLEGVILVFMGFGGFSPSIVRAGIMVSLVLCSRLFHRRTDVLSSLGICAVIMCGMNPYICISESFICSFGSCFAYSAVAPKLTEKLKGRPLSRVTVPLTVTAVVVVVMMPVMALMFNEVTVIAPVTNLLIVPLCTAALSLLLFAMLLGGSTFPAQVIFKAADLLLTGAMKLTDFFASLGFAAVGCVRAPLILAVSAVLIGALIFAVIKQRPRVFAFFTVSGFVGLWAIQSLSNLFARDEVRVTLFGGGRSLCAVVSDGGSCSVIDLGTSGKYAYNIQSCISRSGVRRVDAAFVPDGQGAEIYAEQLFPAAGRIFTDHGVSGTVFDFAETAALGDYSLLRNADGFALQTEKGRIMLTRKGAFTEEGERITEKEILM